MLQNIEQLKKFAKMTGNLPGLAIISLIASFRGPGGGVNECTAVELVGTNVAADGVAGGRVGLFADICTAWPSFIEKKLGFSEQSNVSL